MIPIIIDAHGTVPLCKRPGRVGNRRTNRDHPDCSIVKIGGARGVMVIVIGNGHGDTSSNPGRD